MYVAKQPRMRLLCVALILVFTRPVHAQNGVRPPQGWSLSAAAGGSAYTALQRSSDQTRLSPHTSGIFTAAIAWWPSGNWGLRVHGTERPTRFAEINTPDTTFSDTITYASLTIQAAQLELNFRMPTIHNRIMPYGVLGAGLTRFTARPRGNPLPPEATTDFAAGPVTVRSGTVGIGARLPTRRNGWGIDFELLDQIARTPIKSGRRNEVHTTSAASFTVGLSWTLYSH